MLLFALGAIISGIMVISAIHPVHSVIWLVLSFLNVASLFIILNLDFVGMILLIVYVGAIAILFVFVIMMLNLSKLETELNINYILPLVLLITISFITQIMVIGNTEIYFNDLNNFLEPISFSGIQITGTKFYTIFDSYLIISSLILLIAMVGTIVLTLTSNQTSKKQNLFNQITRDKHNLPTNLHSSNY